MEQEKVVALQQVTKGGGIILGGYFISFLVTFLYQILVARGLGPEGYGRIALGIVLLNVGMILVRPGLSAAMNRFIAFYSAKGDLKRVKGTIISALVLFLVCSAVIIPFGILFSGVIADKLFHAPEMSGLVIIFVLGIPFMALVNMSYESFLGFRRPWFAIITDALLYKLSILVVTCVFLFFGTDVFTLGMVYFGGLLLSSLFAFVLLRRIFPYLFSGKTARYDYRGMVRFAGPLFFAELAVSMSGFGDSLILGYFTRPEEVGLYRIGYSLAALIGTIFLSFSAMFSPAMTGYFARRQKKLAENMYCAVSRMIFMIALPVAMVFIFFSRTILVVLFGPEYAGAWKVLSLLSFAFLAMIVFGPGTTALQSLGRTKTILRIQLTALGISLVLNLLLIPVLGGLGAAIAILVNGCFIYFGSFIVLRRKMEFDFHIASYFKSMVAAAFALCAPYVLLRIFSVANIFVLAVFILVFFIIYFVLLVVLRAFDKYDLMLVKSLEEKLGLRKGLISRIIRV